MGQLESRTRTMKLEYTEISVQDLVRFAQKERRIAIPEFQRPFRWDQDGRTGTRQTLPSPFF
jgi:uncharacterized protein with ParB-like and HNH nuclease domain